MSVHELFSIIAKKNKFQPLFPRLYPAMTALLYIKDNTYWSLVFCNRPDEQTKTVVFVRHEEITDSYDGRLRYIK